MKIVRFLFNDEMARAVVEGRKTVTRRPVMPRPAIPPDVGQHLAPGETLAMLVNEAWQSGFVDVRAPCAPGDLLIGRECHAVERVSYIDEDSGESNGEAEFVYYRATPRVGMRRWLHEGAGPPERVTYLHESTSLDAGPAAKVKAWTPSIHMPDLAARIRRRVISVTVERLQDVTIQDAVREGFSTDRHGGTDARNDFLCAWDDIYLNCGLASVVNPWVWRIEFSKENDQ